MFDDGPFLETCQFGVIHKIVLGLLPFKGLEAELQASTPTINDVDVGGRSALSWAAERADIRAVQVLLNYGAEQATRTIAELIHYTTLQSPKILRRCTTYSDMAWRSTAVMRMVTHL
jgi:ankyrin repeat protein